MNEHGMTIRTRLLLTFAIIVLSFGSLACIEHYHIAEVVNSLRALEYRKVPALSALLELIVATQRSSIKAVEYTMWGKPEDKVKVYEALLQVDYQLQRFLTLSAGKIDASLAKELLVKKTYFTHVLDGYVTHSVRSLMEHYVSSEKPLHIHFLKPVYVHSEEEQVYAARKKLLQSIYPVIERHYAEYGYTTNAISSQIEKAVQLHIGSHILVTVLAIVASALFARSISIPLNYLSALIQRFGQGDPVKSKDIPIQGFQELRVLSQSVAKMIDERDAFEISLRESESCYRELVDNLSDGVAVYEVMGEGEDFVFKDHNHAGQRIAGISRNQVIGKSVQKVFPRIHELGLFDVLQRVWRSGKPIHHPVNLYQDERLSLWVENYVFKLPTGEVVAIYKDITESVQREQAQRESEAKFEAILEVQPDLMFQLSSEGVHLDFYTSNNVDKLYVNPEQFIGKRIEEVLPKAVSDKYIHFIRETLKTSHMHGFEYYLDFSENRHFYDCRMVVGGKNKILAIVREITQLKCAEKELRRLNLELEKRVEDRTRALQEANKELQSFAYSVSHDLRAPLRAIDGFSQALVEDYADQLDEIAVDYLQRVRNGAQNMGMIIDDMLQLSRVNRRDLSMQEVDLGKIAISVLQELQVEEPERQLELTVDKNMLVKGDSRLLRLALSNLLGNAWKFTACETVARISFARRIDQPEIFYISDNGVGFEMRHADKLFGAFQRLHRVTEFPGTGIGLAIVQRIIHRHGGRIWAEAKDGIGATFYFSLEPDSVPIKLIS